VARSEVISFGPYRLIPGERLLLKEGKAVNVGDRALDLWSLSRRPLARWSKRGVFAPRASADF
jgi:hypothetical protein